MAIEMRGWICRVPEVGIPAGWSRTVTAISCTLLSATLFAPAVHAQSGPSLPPRQDTLSPTGVSYANGAFNHEVRDLSIGGGDFPDGLSLDRQYISSLSADFATYAGYRSQGWTHNMTARISNSLISNDFLEEPTGTEPYLYSVNIGNRSIGFLGGTSYPTGGFEGSYENAHLSGESLVFTGTHSTGNFTFTDTNGATLQFNSATQAGALRVKTWVAPDGTKLDFTYDTDGIRSIFSSRGYALLFEYGVAAPNRRALLKACAVNLSQAHASTLSNCPVGSQSVNYGYSVTAIGALALTSATNATGAVTTYSYVGRDHLGCIKQPSQATCQISNTYDVCVRDPEQPYDPPGLSWRDRVISQTASTGEGYSYSYAATCAGSSDGYSSSMNVSGVATTTTWIQSALPYSIVDPIGRTTGLLYTGKNNDLNEFTRLARITYPEGSQAEYAYDTRGNIIEGRTKAKTGTGLQDIVNSAIYPATCADRKICNKPTSATDARGATTTYTYDAVHGGVLTEVGAAVGGVSPAKKYAYAQHYAWLKAAGAGYVQAATPVWVKTEERSCRTTALNLATGACAAGSGDLVLTAYEYQAGNASTPSNVWLKGAAVTADGQTQRACYGYDGQGNRVSETKPKAGLTACP
jgi:YD repeat-containing protein